MNKSIKREWVRALRSKKYKQAAGRLKRNSGYCCIGVLGEVQGIDWDKVTDFATATLPRGLNAGIPLTERLELADRNDRGDSFSEIADYIEQNL